MLYYRIIRRFWVLHWKYFWLENAIFTLRPSVSQQILCLLDKNIFQRKPQNNCMFYQLNETGRRTV